MKANLTGRIFTSASIVAACATTAGLAHAADVHVGVNIGVPAPVYVAPTPVYAPPPPVVYAPPPAPMYVQPAIVIGWHGDRYWDGRRYWSRGDWDRHHGYGRGRGHGHDKHGHGHGNGHGNGHGHGHR